MTTHQDPERVIHLGRPHFLWPDGKLLPVISGGATDDGAGKGDEGKPPSSDAGGTATDPAPESEEDWKRHARTWEQRAKENADAAKKLKELEDAKKSDLDKANERASTAEGKASQAELRALRAEVALDKGLSATLAKRLQGSTREEIEQDADELLAEFGEKKTDERRPASRPKERLSGGSDPTEGAEESDPRKLAERIPRL